MNAKLFNGTVLALLGLSAFGCADPNGSFEGFEKRDGEIHGTSSGTGSGGPCTVPAPDSIDDDYFFTLSSVTGPTKPLAFLAHVKTPATDGGTGIQIDLQPLQASDKSTPVGKPISGPTEKVGADGSFEISIANINVPKEANAIVPAAITADATIDGRLCDPGDFICGPLKGMVVLSGTNLDLSGSNWTMQRITDPKKYPAPILDCAMDKVQ